MSEEEYNFTNTKKKNTNFRVHSKKIQKLKTRKKKKRKIILNSIEPNISKVHTPNKEFKWQCSSHVDSFNQKPYNLDRKIILYVLQN